MKTIEEQALLEYPIDMLETSKGCFDDMNEGERNTWKHGATWYKEELQPVINKLQHDAIANDTLISSLQKEKKALLDINAEQVELMKKMQKYLWADPEYVYRELDKAIEKAQNKL